MEPPKKIEITITCNMLALTKASHILEGKILTMVSMKLAEVAFSHLAPSARVRVVGKRPASLKTLAMIRPMVQAMAVVIMNIATVFQPTEPNFLISPMETIPSIIESKTTGTTMNFKRLTKIVPMGFR